MGQNRGQFARRGLVVLLALTLVAVGVGVTRASHNFSDVLDPDFFHEAVDFLVSRGITAGIGGGLYGPGQAVTRGQMAVFIERALSNCPPDAVRVGPTCIDAYEASVWAVPPTNTDLIRKIQLGTATLAELTAGGTQRGVLGDDYGPSCPNTGNGCTDLYAVSIPGATPSAFLTWFQALAAARNAGKRLPTNQEWQAAALGTPDGAPCRVNPAALGLTGMVGCVSDVGAFDMVGNLMEWVDQWVQRSPISGSWGAAFSNDFMGLNGAVGGGGALGPGVLIRGGHNFLLPGLAGPFTVFANIKPQDSGSVTGFRAAR